MQYLLLYSLYKWHVSLLLTTLILFLLQLFLRLFASYQTAMESKALLYEYLYLSYLNASAESLARANGATQMNDAKYYYLQLRNAQMYVANASTYYSNLAPLLEQMVNELNKSGCINETSFIKG